MELVKQTSAQIIFSDTHFGSEKVEITVRSANDQGGTTKLHCAVIHRLDADNIFGDFMVYDVAIKFIVNIYINTAALWETSESNMKRLVEMPGFNVELEDIPEIQLGTIDSRLPAGTDAYRLYRDNRMTKFGANLFSNTEVGLRIE